MYQITGQQAADAAEIDALLDLAFGPDRLGKISYRFRRGVAEAAALGLIARASGCPGRLIGTVRYWPVAIGPLGRPGGGPALLLGPLAVAPDRQGAGIGTALIDRSLARARGAGGRIVVAVGRLDYYGRFGFGRAAAHGIDMPGEAAERLLVAALTDGALDQVRGPVRPWRSVRAKSNRPAADGGLRRLPAARPRSARPIATPKPPTAASAALAGGR